MIVFRFHCPGILSSTWLVETWLLLKPLVLNPHSTFFKHVYWIAPFLRSQHSSAPPLKFFHASPSSSLLPPLRSRELGAIIIIEYRRNEVDGFGWVAKVACLGFELLLYILL